MDKFKDVLDRYRTLSIFYEYHNPEYEYYYSIGNKDINVEGKNIPSLYKLYMSYVHVPGQEYDFAVEHLGGWKHWKKLCDNANLRKIIAEWHNEMEVKIRASAIKNMLSLSTENNAAGANAAKWLAEKGYELKRGRPSKAEREGYLKKEEQINSAIDEDLERVGLILVK